MISELLSANQLEYIVEKSEQPSIICLMGPTAAGKSDVAIGLSQELPLDLISVDSAMVYRGMDIGSAKPTAEELAIAPHRLIDIRDPMETYSAGDFRVDALREIEAIISHGRTPLLVGGTMLYFKALLHGIAELPTADEAVRAKIAAEAKELGWDVLHQRLAVLDPVAAARIHPNDPQRLQRALEVFVISGKTMTQLISESKVVPLPYQVITMAITPPSREYLHHRIAKRVDKMLEKGLIAETEALLEHIGMSADSPDLPSSMRAVGYRQVCQYLAGEYSEVTLREKIIIATRQLAKRQMTWLRGW